tara:strand:- start:98 stop:238 length:141 start_codon:yes stop_codon:yes gene_type:complete
LCVVEEKKREIPKEEEFLYVQRRKHHFIFTTFLPTSNAALWKEKHQ